MNDKWDYTKIKYYIDCEGRIWSGPFPAVNNYHYKTGDVFASSDVPAYCAEITPLQAAELMRDLDVILEEDNEDEYQSDDNMPF